MQVIGREFYRRLLDSGNILFLCHRNADPDAIGSAFALAEAAGGTVGAVDTLNRAAAAVARYIGIPVVFQPAVEDYDFVVVVDASTGAQINNLQLRRFAFIDHHASIPLADRAEFYLHDDIARSSSEMVYGLLKDEGIEVTCSMATALLAGILTDTANFKYASSGTLRTAAELMDIGGAGLDDVYFILSSVPADVSMRIAMLRAASRAEIIRHDNWLIVTSLVGSFGGEAASALVGIGADVAFVGSELKGKTRVSARARRSAVDAGVNLGKLLEELGREYGGDGGGHDAAAGMEVLADAGKVLGDCAKRVGLIISNRQT